MIGLIKFCEILVPVFGTQSRGENFRGLYTFCADSTLKYLPFFGQFS